MTHAHPFRTGGLLWFVSGLCYVGASFTLGNRTVYALLGLSATLLLALSVGTVHRFMRQDAEEQPLRYGIGALIVGIPFLFVIYSMAYLEAIDAVGQQTADIVNTIVILVGSTLTYGVGPALIAYSGLRHNLVPRWISWLGLIGGVCGMLWAGWVWAIPPRLILIFLPSVLFTYIWQLGLGVVVMRYKQAKPAAVAG